MSRLSFLSSQLPNLQGPLIIAGPCSAESEDQVMQVARALVKIPEVRIFRAGIWKPRTRPGGFEGLGERALPWLARVKKETGLLTATEVANARHAEAAINAGIDFLWIGARTTANPFSVQEIAEALSGHQGPVMVKNPVNAEISLWLGALERLEQKGLQKLIAVHRGFSGDENNVYRNLPLWHMPMELRRRFPNLPIICDPSHIAGKRELIASICQKAMDLDMDGLMVETHCRPDEALSDARQQVTPETLKAIIQSLINKSATAGGNFEQILDGLRARIDRIDNEILEALRGRMDVVEEIGRKKREHNVTVLQAGRMDAMLAKRREHAQGLGLDEDFVEEIFRTIHSESVRIQGSADKDKSKG